MENLLREVKNEIPSVDEIIEKTWKNLHLKKSNVKKNFGEILCDFDVEATKIFRDYESKVLIKLAKLWLNSQKIDIQKKLKEIVNEKGWNEFIEKASKVFVEFGILVQSLEKDLGNMRKARGGKTFEKVVLRLLNFIDINAEIPVGKAREDLKRIDIVIPSIEIAKKTPDRAIFLTCKRTLRERWKQEVPQARLNQRIYLITIDNDISESKAKEINEKGLIAFVRDDLVQNGPLKNLSWIRKLSDLPKEINRI
jgi:hypothetical protein